MKKNEIIQEFIDKNSDSIPGVYFVDFVYLPTNMFYRHMGFYYTLNEAIEKATEKIVKKYDLQKQGLIYNSNLFLNSKILLEHLAIRFVDEIEIDTDQSTVRTINQKMGELIKAGDPKLVEESDLNNYQKQYVLDKIKNDKR